MQILLLMCISAGLVCAAFPPASADLTGDGVNNLSDFCVFSSSWMTTLPWWPDGRLPQKIAHWSFDQNAMDSQSTFDGTSIGEPIWFTKKNNPNDVKIGSGAVGFNSQDSIEINGSEFPQFYGSFTLDVWFKIEYSQQTQTIISKGSSSWQIGIEGGTGKAFFSCPGLSGTNYLIGNTFLSDGRWHHLAAVYDCDNEQIYLYLDGVIDAQASAAGQVDENDLNIWIGGNPQTADYWYHGILDNLCVYNYALNLEQVFERQTYHVDVKTGVDVPNPPDPEWGQGKQQAFKTIQHAIDVAQDGDMILVWPGLYQESLIFMGKAITVRSVADAAILEPDPADVDGIPVTFMYGEQSNSVLEHFVIVNSNTALWIHQSSPTLRHLTVVNNDYGIESIFNSHPVVEHCIFWNNTSSDITWDTYAPVVTYSCVQRSYSGVGNISNDPLFVNPDMSDPNTLDFHLQSEYGRYVSDGNSVQRPWPENWVVDNQTSPCIDAGRPDINPFCETMSNGGRINMGAYGDTPFAGKSPWGLPADMSRNGQVHVEDILLFSEQWLQIETP
jgi:hypothetical protein